MVFGIANKQNVKLFFLIAFGLALFSLFFIPMEQWTFVIDWLIQTPIIVILGQSIFFFVSIVLIWAFVLIIRELLQ